MIRHSLLSLVAALPAFAATQTFDFKDPKGVNTVTFKLDAPLEAISGSANGVSGSAEFDPEHPGALKGKILVATKSMTVPNSMMKEHMDSEGWMNVATHPEITFEAESTSNVKGDAGKWTADLTGKLTIKGTTKTVTVPVSLTLLKDAIKKRGGFKDKDGDILVVRSTFKVSRTDFGVNPGAPEDKVSNEIELGLALAGFAPR
jgi:polyisoprenoid-binding protein YceI